MSRPSFGGVGVLRGGDHEHHHGRQHLRQAAHVLAPEAPGVAWRVLAWRGVACFGMVWRGVTWHGVAWRTSTSL